MDISGQLSKSVDEFAARNFDYVLTVCDNPRESCQIYPSRGNSMLLKTRRRCKGLRKQSSRRSAKCAMTSVNIRERFLYKLQWHL